LKQASNLREAGIDMTHRRESMTTTNQFSATIRIGILVYEGFEPIDVWGFTKAFAISRFIGTDYQSPPPYPFEI